MRHSCPPVAIVVSLLLAVTPAAARDKARASLPLQAALAVPAGLMLKEGPGGLILATTTGEPLYRLDFDRGAPPGSAPSASPGKARPDNADDRGGRRAISIDMARCADFCKRYWAPVPAPALFRPSARWSALDRPAGRQLAYDGVPLYRFTGETMDLLKTSPVFPPYVTGYSAPAAVLVDGVPSGTLYWHTVAFRPEAPDVSAPAGITPRWAGKSFGLADSSGKTLYAPATVPECVKGCADVEPLRAPLAAQPVGDWRPADSDDGVRRWTYKGKPVYRAASDNTPDASQFVPLTLD